MEIGTEKNLSEKEERRKRLMEEVLTGKVKKDVLLNTSYRFSGEAAADYFAQMGVFMRSSLARMIMHNHTDCPERIFFERLKGVGNGE